MHVGQVAAPANVAFMAASSHVGPQEPIADSQGTLDVVRGSPGTEPRLGSASIDVAAAVNASEGPLTKCTAAANSPTVTKPFPSDEVAPSMLSPTLVCFEVLGDLRPSGAVSDAPGLVSHGPPKVVNSAIGLMKDSGPCVDGRGAGGYGEATECLPASPRSPLCFISDEATELPASP